ncbi:phycobiliprotein lyase [Rubidibacter lacunae]|uniref:phycobiliprotein lyase n=1 Tax=Rubidibacter lacunae TaxID=582514 RepID=UPI00058EBCCB|nr:phycobiliprotein lyase [Rubidibacter lacunae]
MGSTRAVVATHEQLIAAFFQASAGKWHSERRYYTLPQGKTKEVCSRLEIELLDRGCEELHHLEALHQLDADALVCGTRVSWCSIDAETGRLQSEDSTLFGALGNQLYRDRGFAIDQPVAAQFHFINPQTLCLRTEYKGSSFEEELKLIGDRYRTRQTIVARAGEQKLIGQYLETRL